jgi:Cd2+/Zn2+-exporting ATPase
VPLSFFAGIGAASRFGILIKGSNYLELMSKANIFVFDKTGTLTKGNFAVTDVSPVDKKDDILRLAAIAENDSNHPIARSIVACYDGEIEGGYTLTNVAGFGVIATKGDDVIYCGNEKLMKSYDIPFVAHNGVGTVVYVAHNNEHVGSLLISDEIKNESASAVAELNKMGCKTVMLTGDNEAIASDVAAKIGLSGYKASLLPQNKVENVEQMLKDKKKDEVLCFVGDGINDAPVLMRSDIGIAMGGVGSDGNRSKRRRAYARRFDGYIHCKTYFQKDDESGVRKHRRLSCGQIAHHGIERNGCARRGNHVDCRHRRRWRCNRRNHQCNARQQRLQNNR